MKKTAMILSLVLVIMLSGLCIDSAIASVPGLHSYTNENSASSRILIYHQGGNQQADWQSKVLALHYWSNSLKKYCDVYMGSNSPSGYGWGCGIYSLAHAVQWAGGFSMNSSNGGDLLDAFITKNSYPWDVSLKDEYASVISSYGVSTENVPATETGLLNFFNNGGAIVTHISDPGGHYQCAIGIASGPNGETWIHMLDSTCYSTIYRLNDKGYSAYNFSTGAVQSSTSNYGGGEYWITYTAYCNCFSKIVAMTGNGPVYADLGEDFYAMILNTNYWKPISESQTSNGIIIDSLPLNTARQKWRFQRQADSSYVISSCFDGNILEMDQGIRENAKQLTAPHNNFWGGAYQKWYLVPCNGAFIIKSCHYPDENWVIDLCANSAVDGTPVQIYERNNTSAQIWSIYAQDDVQLRGPDLQVTVGNAVTETVFSWEPVFGAKSYNVRIFKDTLWDGEDYSLWDSTTGNAILLPPGDYVAYVDAINYYECKMGQTISFTVPDIGIELNVIPSDELLSIMSIKTLDELETQAAYYSEHIREHLTVEVNYSDGSKQVVTDYAVETWIEHSDDKPLIYGYDFKVTYGDLSDTSEINITLNPLPVYGQPDFTLPEAIISVDESAFEGIAATIVYIPDTCTSIGKWAFKDCSKLTQIRIPSKCAIGTDVFSGCVNVVLFGTKGSAAETYANSHSNCTFVAE